MTLEAETVAKPDPSQDQASQGQTHPFQAEVAQLLRLMVHAVYSETDVFLRELISNASDACDKLRYEAIARPELLEAGGELAIRITPDTAAGTLTVADTGIGMDRAELIDNLGTVARSGTRAFIERLAEAKDGTGLIGQFGVGFYSAFMVADRIEVTSRRAGAAEAFVWTSSGDAGFEIGPASEAQAARVARGTEIVLHLKPEAKKYLENHEIERIVHTYSDHILFPIELVGEKDEPRQVNAASAIWQRPKSELKPEDYAQAYRSIAMMFDEPAMTLHYRAEGRQSYAVLLFAPSTAPYDLFDRDRKGHVKLYVRRVYITDDANLLPSYLRFVRGVVDSEDLPLNISREMLQNNPQVAQIRKAITGRVLSELEALAAKDTAGGESKVAETKDGEAKTDAASQEPKSDDTKPDQTKSYEKIWAAFGAVLKEGIYEDFERRNQLLGLARFTTTAGTGRSLKQYAADLKTNQTAIYYLVGDERRAAQIQSQAGGGTRPRHRGVAAHRPGRCLLDRSIARLGRQAAEILEPGRCGFRPGSADRTGNQAGRDRQGGNRRRDRHRDCQTFARGSGIRRARLAAAHRQRGVPGRRRQRSRPRIGAAVGAAQPRRGGQADP